MKKSNTMIYSRRIYKKRKKLKKKKIFLFLFFILSLSLISMYKNISIENIVKEPREIKLEFENKENIYTITEKLYEEKLINNKFLFRLLSKLNNFEYIDRKNTFIIKDNSDMGEIIKILKKDRDYDYKVVMYSGESIEKFIDIFSEKIKSKKNNIIDKINSREYIEYLLNKYPLLPKEILDLDLRYKLEGFIYPGEYLLKENETIECLIEKSLDRFFENFRNENIEVKLKNKNKTLFEVLSLASLVRGEVNPNDKENQKKVAGVFYNRLNNNMKLQSDPTVAYTIKKNKENFTKEELAIESQYNTYYVKGMPIGPIGNPDISFLDSVLDFTKTDYLYFLVDMYNDKNKFYYSNTYDEHMENIEKYLTGKR